jgi:hypothetical protein
MAGMRRRRTGVAALLALILIFGIAIRADGAEPIHSLILPLPGTLAEADFSTPGNAFLEINGIQQPYPLRGTPFLYDNGKTYIPARDVADAFGLSVFYNPDDRYVRLSSGNQDFIIGPAAHPFSDAYMWAAFSNGKETAVGSSGYVTRNNISYVPLRVVMEYFGFRVDYTAESGQITISGNLRTPARTDFFEEINSDAVTRAFADYEGAPSVHLSGTYVSFGGPQKLEVTMNTAQTESATDISYDIRINDKQRYTAHASGTVNANAASVLRSSDAPFPKGVVPGPAGHPYSRIGTSSHSGIGKYRVRAADHILVESTDTADRYQISREISGAGAVIFIEYAEISRTTGKLTKIIVISDGVVTSNFALSY